VYDETGFDSVRSHLILASRARKRFCFSFQAIETIDLVVAVCVALKRVSSPASPKACLYDRATKQPKRVSSVITLLITMSLCRSFRVLTLFVGRQRIN
jgi:hypothetical protein